MNIDLSRFRVLEKLGSGANSDIFRVRCVRTRVEYSIKKVKVHQPEDMKFIEQLRDEFTVGSALDHPVLRKVHQMDVQRRRLRIYIATLVMEYVDGVPLSDNSLTRSLSDVLRVFDRIADGLAHMHEAGFVHADLKPGNILVTPNDDVKLIDFGQSTAIGSAKSRIQGTIDYMAPEQVARESLDRRTDVFALGATLHRVLTGKPVATDMNQNITLYATGLLGRRLDRDLPQADELPTCVVRLINACCHKSPDERIADMRAFRRRMELVETIVAALDDRKHRLPAVGDELSDPSASPQART